MYNVAMRQRASNATSMGSYSEVISGTGRSPRTGDKLLLRHAAKYPQLLANQPCPCPVQLLPPVRTLCMSSFPFVAVYIHWWYWWCCEGQQHPGKGLCCEGAPRSPHPCNPLTDWGLHRAISIQLSPLGRRRIDRKLCSATRADLVTQEALRRQGRGGWNHRHRPKWQRERGR